jgi:NAD(P) transhydrogenase
VQHVIKTEIDVTQAPACAQHVDLLTGRGLSSMRHRVRVENARGQYRYEADFVIIETGLAVHFAAVPLITDRSS